MKRLFILIATYCLLLAGCLTSCQSSKHSDFLTAFPKVSEVETSGYFGLLTNQGAATICVDANDAKVVGITANMLADDVERVTGQRPVIQEASSLEECSTPSLIIAGTIGQSHLIDQLIASGLLSADEIQGQWEASVIATVTLPTTQQRALVIAGNDRRGTAFGLTSLSRAMGVSPWYWWADVTPAHKDQLFVQAGRYVESGPSVQYRGIFINDERFGGWARWVENTFDTETHQVGHNIYKKVFELLLRLRGNYLWPAMHPSDNYFFLMPGESKTVSVSVKVADCMGQKPEVVLQ